MPNQSHSIHFRPFQGNPILFLYFFTTTKGLRFFLQQFLQSPHTLLFYYYFLCMGRAKVALSGGKYCLNILFSNKTNFGKAKYWMEECCQVHHHLSFWWRFRFIVASIVLFSPFQKEAANRFLSHLLPPLCLLHIA